MHKGLLWIPLIFALFVGDVLRPEQAVATELAQAGGNSDAARHQAEEAQRRQAEEQRHQAEEAQRRQAEEQRRQAEEAQRRQAEEQRRQAEDAQRRQAEEQRRQAEDAQRRHADEQRRQAEDAQRRQADEQRRQAQEPQRRQPEEAQRPQAEEQRRQAEPQRPQAEEQRRQAEDAQHRQADEAQRRQAEERRRQAEEEETLRTRYGCIIAERLTDSRYRLVCGARSVIVHCSTIECPEAGAELSRLEQEERQRREEEALLRVHGCKIITRLGGSQQFALACGEHRITVVCSTPECPEAGAELRRLSADAAQRKDELRR